MRIQELEDLEKDIKVNGLKEVKSQQIYRAQNLFNSDGLFSEEIFGQTNDERSYRCGYIKLPIHVFNPFVAKYIISRSGGIIKKMATGEVKCNIVNGVLVADKDGKYTGMKDLYDIWDEIDVRKTLNTRSTENIDILTKSPKRLIFNDKVLVLPPNMRPIGVRNGKTVKSELNSLYLTLLGLKSVNAHTTSNVYQVWNKFQDAVVNIFIYVNNYVSGKNGFFQKNLLAKNTIYTARNVISAPRYNTEHPSVGIFRTGYPLHTCVSLFKPLVMFHLKQFFSYSNIQSIHSDPNEINSAMLANIYDSRMIEDLCDIYMKNPGSRFKIMYLDDVGEKPIKMTYLDMKTNQTVTRPLTLTDVMYLACKSVIVDADRHVYCVRYPIGDYMGAFFTKVHILSTNDTTRIQFNGEIFEHYPIINLEAPHNRVATSFADTLTPSNSRLNQLCGDYDGDTVKSTGIWSDEANKKAEELMYSKIYNIKPECASMYPIAIECLQGLYGLTKGANKKG